MADYQIRVSADTKNAQAQLVKVDKAADKATRARDIKIGVPDVSKVAKAYDNIRDNASKAANGIKQFYNFSKKIPAIGERVEDVQNLATGINDAAKAAPQLAANLKENAKAGNILATSVKTTNSALMTMVTNLAKVGFAIYAVKEAVNLLQGAFQGFFNDTIGREIQLRETLLKTQTTLASTSKVFKNGKEITDPLEKIETLTSSVEENIKSIRQRSLELAGVTSGEVIEVFGMVAQQISNIGGGLKEAEDLAIQFAAALGTFGIPLYQARQEIGSILRGDITMDSYLAKSLGITNEDIAEAKTKAGGVVKFLEDRLKAAVAGQAIAAKGFAGVTSNIAEIAEEIKRNFGAGLLDPLLGGLTNVYELMFKISAAAFKAANTIGKTLGNSLSNIAVLLGGAGIRSIDIGAELAQSISSAFEGAINKLSQDMIFILEPLKNVFGEIIKSVAVLAQGLGKLAAGFASLQVEKFKALINALEAITPILTGIVAGFSELLKLYGDVLKQPIVQYFAQLGVTMKLVEGLGVKMAVQLGALAAVVIAKWKPVVAFFAALGAKITATLAVIMTGAGTLFAKIGAVVTAFAGVLLKAVPASEALALSLQKLAAQMGVMGANATKAGAQVGTMAGVMKGAAVSIGGMVMNLIKLNLIIFAVVGLISLVIDGLGRWKRAQEKAARGRAAEQSLKNLKSGLYDVKDGLDAATQAKKDFDEAMVRAQQDAVKEELNEVLTQIRELEERTKNWKSKSGLAYRKSRLNPLKKEEARLLKELNRLDFEQKKKNAKDIISLESDMRRNLEKEIKELRKQFADDEFRFRQRLQRAQLDRFRAESDLELQRMSSRLQARLKGEEGASRVFLENLNDYLTTKKRGEDEIAARQQEMQMTLASLNKEIADYKLETEKKIAKLQKEMGEYQKKVADYKLDQARNEAAENAVTGKGGTYVQGNVGPTSTGPHFDIKRLDGQYFDRAALDKYVSVNGGALSAGTTVPGGQFGASRSYGEHRGWDYAFGDGAKLNLKGGAEFVSSRSTQHGDATIFMTPDGTKYQILHGKFMPNEKGNVAPAVDPGPGPDIEGIGNVDPSKITAALSAMNAVLAETVNLQNQLTSEQTQEKLNKIAEGMFSRTDLEPLQDALATAKSEFAATAAEGRNITEAAKAELVYRTELARIETERGQALTDLAEYAVKEQMSAEAVARAEQAINTAAAEKKTNLAEALKIRQEILSVTKAQSLLDQMQNDTLQLQDQIAANMLQMRMELEGYDQAEIAAAQRKLVLQQELERVIAGMNPKTQAKEIAALRNAYAQLATQIDKAAQVQIQMRNPLRQLFTQWKADLANVNRMYAQMAQTVMSELSNAMSSAITGVIDGTTTVKEAFANMFKNIGKAFIDMATQMIAKAIVMKALGIFLPGLSGGFNMGTTQLGAGGGQVGGIGTLGPNFGFQVGNAQGAYVNTATPALIGEGGVPEYVIPENKMADSLARFAQGMRGDGVVKGANTSFSSQNRSQATPTALGDVSRRFNPGNNYSNTNNYGADGAAADNFSINITGEQLVSSTRRTTSARMKSRTSSAKHRSQAKLALSVSFGCLKTPALRLESDVKSRTDICDGPSLQICGQVGLCLPELQRQRERTDQQ